MTLSTCRAPHAARRRCGTTTLSDLPVEALQVADPPAFFQPRKRAAGSEDNALPARHATAHQVREELAEHRHARLAAKAVRALDSDTARHSGAAERVEEMICWVHQSSRPRPSRRKRAMRSPPLARNSKFVGGTASGCMACHAAQYSRSRQQCGGPAAVKDMRRSPANHAAMCFGIAIEPPERRRRRVDFGEVIRNLPEKGVLRHWRYSRLGAVRRLFGPRCRGPAPESGAARSNRA